MARTHPCRFHPVDQAAPHAAGPAHAAPAAAPRTPGSPPPPPPTPPPPRAARRQPSLLGSQPRSLVLGGQLVDELVQIALHHPVDLVQRQIDPMVGHAALREIIGADALAAIPG